ncbi:MAG: hypothetical protein AB2L22_09860 [Syntrophales bacterium]
MTLDGRFKDFRADIEASLEAFRRACDAVGQELAVNLSEISWITLDASNFSEFVRPE